MKITRRQIRQIIKEATSPTDMNFGDNAPHPMLRDNYMGNGYVVSMFEPIMDWLDENHAQSEETALLHSILTGEVKGLRYVPFMFGDRALKKMLDLGAPRDVIRNIQYASARESNEYNPPGW